MRIGVALVLTKGIVMKLAHLFIPVITVMAFSFNVNAQVEDPAAMAYPDSESPYPSYEPMCIDTSVISAVVYVPCPSVPPLSTPPPLETPDPCAPVDVMDEPEVLDEELVYAGAVVLPKCEPTPEPTPTPTTNEEVVPTPTPVATPVTQVTTPTNAIEGASCNLQMAGAGMLPMQANGYLMLVVTWLFGNLFFKRDK